MERTQIYMTEDQKKILALLSEKTGESQSVLIRKALDEFIAKESKGRLNSQKEFWSSYAGTWDNKEDSQAFVATLRAGADSRLSRLHVGLSEDDPRPFETQAMSMEKAGARSKKKPIKKKR